MAPDPIVTSVHSVDAGLVEYLIRPPSCALTQKDADGQDVANTPWVGSNALVQVPPKDVA